MSEEIWVPIHGYSNYLISNMGRVKTLYYCRGEKIRKLELSHKGYWRVTLTGHSKRRWYNVHRLVAQHFIPNPHKYPQVNHKNSIRNDNRVENLEWCTCAMNIQHSYDTGNRLRMYGERHHQCKLTKEQVYEIRNTKQDATVDKHSLARKYKVSTTTINDIWCKRTWQHLPERNANG